jgi:hypothetical protein
MKLGWFLKGHGANVHLSRTSENSSANARWSIWVTFVALLAFVACALGCA